MATDLVSLAYRLNAREAYVTRQLPDGRVIDVIPLTFGRARLLLSRSLAVLGADAAW